MYICACRGVTESQIQEAVAEGAQTLTDLEAMTGAATGCGGCDAEVEAYLPSCEDEGARLGAQIRAKP